MHVKAQRLLKRILDIGLSLCALVLLSPVLILLGAAVRIFMGAPVLFRQARAGRHGAPFEMIKFRTMSNARDARGKLLADAERLNWFGQMLRTLSLDELPQLWCVLRGEMSLVGPRPLPVRYLPRYSEIQSRRHHVLPGITGWAQVNGRNTLAWETKFEYDTWYADHWSLRLDLHILWRTAAKVLIREGIQEEGQATMCEFMGSAEAAAETSEQQRTSAGAYS